VKIAKRIKKRGSGQERFAPILAQTGAGVQKGHLVITQMAQI
jgi:hypothetical protein